MTKLGGYSDLIKTGKKNGLQGKNSLTGQFRGEGVNNDINEVLELGRKEIPDRKKKKKKKKQSRGMGFWVLGGREKRA